MRATLAFNGLSFHKISTVAESVFSASRKGAHKSLSTSTKVYLNKNLRTYIEEFLASSEFGPSFFLSCRTECEWLELCNDSIHKVCGLGDINTFNIF